MAGRRQNRNISPTVSSGCGGVRFSDRRRPGTDAAVKGQASRRFCSDVGTTIGSALILISRAPRALPRRLSSTIPRNTALLISSMIFARAATSTNLARIT